MIRVLEYAYEIDGGRVIAVAGGRIGPDVADPAVHGIARIDSALANGLTVGWFRHPDGSVHEAQVEVEE